MVINLPDNILFAAFVILGVIFFTGANSELTRRNNLVEIVNELDNKLGRNYLILKKLNSKK
jgi:hypothetical protein